MKLPVPVPLDVLVFNEMVGLGEVLQTIPRETIAALPSELILPPHRAEVVVMESMELVLTTGMVKANVVNVRSVPYAVPTLFVAYALT